jgi:ATP-dependent phosphoenolpyruvate carboxykinase
MQTWSDNESYNKTADNLAEMFVENFKRYQAGVSDAVNSSSPKTLVN